MIQDLSRSPEAFIKNWLVFDRDERIYISQLKEAYQFWLGVERVPGAGLDDLIEKIVQREAVRGLYGITDIACIYGVALRRN